MYINKIINYFQKTMVFNEEMLNNFPNELYKKKSHPVIEVWENMTVKELADSAKRNINDVLDVLHIVNDRNIYDKNSILSDGHLLSTITKKLGAKSKIISKQTSNEGIKYKDITRR